MIAYRLFRSLREDNCPHQWLRIVYLCFTVQLAETSLDIFVYPLEIVHSYILQGSKL